MSISLKVVSINPESELFCYEPSSSVGEITLVSNTVSENENIRYA